MNWRNIHFRKAHPCLWSLVFFFNVNCNYLPLHCHLVPIFFWEYQSILSAVPCTGHFRLTWIFSWRSCILSQLDFLVMREFPRCALMPVLVSKANPQLLSGYSGLVTNKTSFIDVDIILFTGLKTDAARISSLPLLFSIKLDGNYRPRILWDATVHFEQEKPFPASGGVQRKHHWPW